MKRVVFTAGHGPAGKDPGARFPATGTPLIVEHDEALLWVSRIASAFNRLGGDAVVLEGNDLEALPKTIAWINRLTPKAEAAIEIHFNDARDQAGRQVGRGCETLYHPTSKRGQAIAIVIQQALAPLFPPDRGAVEGWLKGDRPGVVDYPGDHDGDEHLGGYLVQTNCPAVIVEPEFVVNHGKIRQHRDEACAAIARGLRALEFGTRGAAP